MSLSCLYLSRIRGASSKEREIYMNKPSKSSIFICPACGVHLSCSELEGEPKLTEVQKIVQAWKLTVGVPEDDKTWDKEHFPRCSKPAKSLLNLFGFEKSVHCIEYIHAKYKLKGFPITSLEGILKHSDEFREVEHKIQELRSHD